MLLLCGGTADILAQTTGANTKNEYSTADSMEMQMDSIEFSLITCAPHEQIYSLYGHTAIRMVDRRKSTRPTDSDVVFNWGVFDYNKPHFVSRFVFGLTDYELGVFPFDSFCKEYRHWGSQVTEQVLNLTPTEKANLLYAIMLNCSKENRVYRYNFFYDNCSTRPRRIIEGSLNGELLYSERQDYAPSFRTMVREKTRNHPWATFGNDFLLGVDADQPTSRSEQEFLPENLMYDFDQAQIYSNGEYRPLVKERRMVVSPGVQIIENDFPLSPTWTGILILAATLIIILTEYRRHTYYKLYTVLLMTIVGVMGCVPTIMIFSEHPTVSLNLQILLFNPTHLMFIPAVIRGKNSTYMRLLLAMFIAFEIGAIFQSYADGIQFLALSLLSREWIRLGGYAPSAERSENKSLRSQHMKI